jgi:hypothetical protein
MVTDLKIGGFPLRYSLLGCVEGDGTIRIMLKQPPCDGLKKTAHINFGRLQRAVGVLQIVVPWRYYRGNAYTDHRKAASRPWPIADLGTGESRVGKMLFRFLAKIWIRMRLLSASTGPICTIGPILSIPPILPLAKVENAPIGNGWPASDGSRSRRLRQAWRAGDAPPDSMRYTPCLRRRRRIASASRNGSSRRTIRSLRASP